MSTTRPIWNDGQGLTTPDLQRPCDTVGGADDRAHEVLLTPGTVQKKVLPLSEESLTLNPRLLAIPSSAGLTPAGINGAVRVMPFSFIAGTAANTQQISLTGNTFAAIDTTAIGSNSSGSIRYDLVYATLTRQVTVSASRRIKSASDGSVSSQTINLADAPTITLNINVGFLTGATAPTNAQILAALPADTTTSFSVALTFVTVANGYSSGTTLFQSSSGGTTYLTQCWPGGYIQSSRVRLARYGSLVDKNAGTTGQATTPIGGSRFINMNRLLVPVTVTAISQTIQLDDVIDWRQRILTIKAVRCTTTNTNVAGRAWENPNALPTASGGGTVQIICGPFFTMGTAQAYAQVFGQDATPYWNFRVNTSNVLQALYMTQPLASGSAASDVWWMDIEYTDQFIF